MPRRFQLLACLLLGWATAATMNVHGAEPVQRPNVIFILADDLGWTDLSCFGSGYYESPNIDRLALSGIKLTNAYSCGPNCQPTRAALMSGQYAPRTGVYTVGGINRFDWQSRTLKPVENVVQLPLNKKTLAQSLKAAGYATGMFGKWHLGEEGKHHPGKRGFDEALVSMGRHFHFVTNPKVEHPPEEYLADFLTDRAVDFMDRHQKEPFFLYLPHFGVHSPFEAKQEWIRKFEQKSGVGDHKSPVYAAMIASVDESVGRIVKKLEELKLRDNTLIVFTSDNGGVGGYRREGVQTGHDITDNTPLRSGKGSLYEGGIRVPLICSWPGHIPAQAESATPMNTVDYYPTLLAAVGATPPTDYTLDGTNCLELLTSGGKGEFKHPPLFWHFPGYLGASKNTWRTTPVSVIRAGSWKLMEFYEDGHLELYNLASDLSEKQNLASAQPEQARELHEQLVRWRTEINAPLPQPNEPKAPQTEQPQKPTKPAKKAKGAKKQPQ